MKAITTSKGQQFKIEPSAYSLVVYRQACGRDLFADLMAAGDALDGSMLLNVLFAFVYSHAEVDYTEFMKGLPANILTDTNFLKSLMEIIQDVFEVEDTGKGDSTPR